MPNREFFKELFQEAVELPDALSCLSENLKERYVESKLLGQGGLKEVYQVMDTVTGRLVAMAYPKSGDHEAHDLFIREARLQSLLQHPNIIPVYNMGLEEEKPWFTMKLISGERLDHYVKNLSELTVDRENNLLDIFIKICDAVSYAHSQNILHLDLKPENIFVDDYGEVLVGDWGLARIQGVAELDMSLPLPNQHLGQGSLYGYMTGTPGYMAPEQCRKGSDKGFYTDLYSLGAILHYLFTEEAIQSGSPEEILEQCKNGKYNLRSESFAPGLLAILLKCLKHKAADRYASVDLLKRDIDAYRSGFLTSAEQSSFLRQLKLLFKRNSRICYLIFISILMVLLLSSGFMYKLQKSESLARANEMRAREQTQRSEENLAKYLSTEKQRQTAVIKLAESYISLSDKIFQSRQGISGYDSSRDREAYELISGALLVDGNSHQAWALKGRLAIRLGLIASAQESFLKAGENYKKHVELCRQVLATKSAGVDQQKALLGGLLKIRERALMYDVIFKYIYSDLPEVLKVELVHKALGVMNMREINFSYDAEKRSLNVSKNAKLVLIFPLKNMGVFEIDISSTAIDRDFSHVLMPRLRKLVAERHQISPKNFLSIEGHEALRELSIAYSQSSDLTFLASLKLEKLNVRGIPCRDFSVLQQCEELQVIYCQRQQEKLIRPFINEVKLIFEDEL